MRGPIRFLAVAAVLAGCGRGTGERSAEAGTRGRYPAHDVIVDERACSLVVGRATPTDVIELYGWPLSRAFNGQSAIASLVYMHRDPLTPVPDIVFFLFRRRSDRTAERLIGAMRITSAGPYGFSCFRDLDGNEVQPIGLVP
jgi:hypothetical protein